MDKQLQAQHQLLNQRYTIQDTLGRGSMGEVFRATDRLTGEHVALKWVGVKADSLLLSSTTGSINSQIALAQEFQLLASLRHPNIISVLDYGFDSEHLPFFTMTLLHQPRNLLEKAQELNFKGKVELLVQVLQALAYLHRRGIIHRDLKPSNVMVVDAQVKVLDFGLAIKQENISTDSNTLVGTLLYMAPEVIRGEEVSVASDLYAVGVIAYEMFGGKFPFAHDTHSKFITELLHVEPNWDFNAPEGLKPVIQRLMQKDPSARYTEIAPIIADLSDAVGLELPKETIGVRESFLQAAQFVGRNKEFRQLEDALTALIDRQKGGLWLISGESGVGKSRLLNELRPLALAQGVQVLRGQAIVEGGAPYLVWREALRHLLLQVDVAPHEASVLKPIIPDIDTLLQQTIPNAPDVDPKTAQARLLKVISAIFERQTQPTLVLLEDLQWGSESLDVLKYLQSQIPDAPLLFVGSYRDDETPRLAEDFPQAQKLHLTRLAEDAIADLSASMLGETIGRQPQVIALLQRETEGNVFFIVEVMRSLAEEAGQLAAISELHLPEKVFTGGIEAVIQQRLSRVPQKALPLLQSAAVAGREIDLNLLKTLYSGVNLDEWLTLGTNSAVLEVFDNQWRFAHDKIRDAILSGIPTDAKPTLHRQIAEAIELIYPDNPTTYVPLAYHWTAAGNSAKAHHWSIKSGEQALSNGILPEALAYFQKAVELQSDLPLSVAQQARTYRLYARTYLGLGQIAESAQIAEQGMKLMGYGIPGGDVGARLAIVNQATRQILLQTGIPLLNRRQSETLIEAAKTARILGEAYIWLGVQSKIAYTALLGLNIAEQVHDPEIASRNYSNACYFLSVSPFKRLAPFYLGKTVKVREKTDNRLVKVDSYFVEGLHYLHIAQLAKADETFAIGKTLAREMGDEQRWILFQAQQIGVRYHLGKFAEAEAMGHEMEASTRQQQNIQYLIWSLGLLAGIDLRKGKNEEALTLLQEALEYLKQAKDVLAKVFLNGQIAVAYLRLGNDAKALEHAEVIYKGVTTRRTSGHGGLEGYPALVEVYTALWQKDPSNQVLQHKAQSALKALERYTHLFETGKPRYWLWRGHFAQIEGNPKRAAQYWEKSLNYAETFAMPYEQGLAHAALATLNRPDHLARARELFKQVGATWDLEHLLKS